MLWLGMWLWVNGQQGRDNCVLVTILPCRGHGKEGLAPREHKYRKNRKISRVFLCFFSGLHYLCKQKLNDGSY